MTNMDLELFRASSGNKVEEPIKTFKEEFPVESTYSYGIDGFPVPLENLLGKKIAVTDIKYGFESKYNKGQKFCVVQARLVDEENRPTSGFIKFTTASKYIFEWCKKYKEYFPIVITINRSSNQKSYTIS